MSWYAKIYVGFVLAYLFSPIDLIPDFLPIIGYLDELALMPVFIAVARKLIPAPVLIEHRARAGTATPQGRPMVLLGAVVIVAVWFIFSSLAMLVIWNILIR